MKECLQQVTFREAFSNFHSVVDPSCKLKTLRWSKLSTWLLHIAYVLFINFLLTESVVITGKYQTDVLTVMNKRSRLITSLLYGFSEQHSLRTGMWRISANQKTRFHQK